MSTRRRVALFVASAVVACLLVLAILPFAFRGKIEARVKTEIGKNVAATVDWKSAGLTFFHDFPNLTLGLEGLSVTGVDRFRGDTLVAMDRVRLVLDLGSVLRSLGGSAPIVIRAVELDRPAAHLLVLEDGAANWNIMKARPSGGPSKPLNLSLKRVEIRDGALSYDDRKSKLQATVVGLTESLSGDFRQSRFDLETKTGADTISVRFGGIPYLDRARLELDATLGVDNAARKITVKNNRIRVNDLELALNGSVVTRPDSSMDLDLSVRAPRTDFKQILSLVPVVYAHSFSNVQASGTMALAGWVRGHYAANAFPAMSLEAKVENGSFRYPDLPLPARDIAFQLAVSNPGGTADATVVNLQRFHVVIGSNPVDGSLLVRTPVSDPDVDARVVGRVDLGDVARTVKLPSLEQLTGVVAADAAMRARVSDVNTRRYERVAASGSASITGLVLRAKDVAHPVEITNAQLRLSPQHVEVSSFRGKLGKSDVALTGFMDNVLGYLLHDEPLRGQAKVSSSSLDLNEWRSGGKLQVIPVPANVDFALDAAAERVAFGPLTLQHATGALVVKNRRVDLKDFRFDMLGGAVTMTGSYETTNLARPTFDFDMKAANLEVPAAFAGLKTVQAFVPVAQYTQGKASVDMKLAGPLTQDMMPELTALSAAGLFQTAGVVLKEFPAMIGLANLLKVQELRDPGFKDLKSGFEIKNGRLVVKPFDAHVGQLTMNVAGSNGIDRSLDYTLALKLPRAALGAEANQVVTRLVSQSGQLGLKLQPSDVVTLGVRLGGSVTKPTLATNVRDVAGSAVAGVGQALQQAATTRIDSAKQRLDAAALAAQQRASAEAAQLTADAEQKAAAIRSQARALADAGRQQAYAQADSLAAKPTGALAKAAARAAADRLKKEADARAQQVVAQADARADSLVAQAKVKAAALQAH